MIIKLSIHLASWVNRPSAVCERSCLNLKAALNLKEPNTTAADDINIFFIVFRENKT